MAILRYNQHNTSIILCTELYMNSMWRYLLALFEFQYEHCVK